jgi:DUF1680 family protein
VKLVLTTAYPAEETISIRVETSAPQLWTMRLRIPAWLEQPAQITVNGASAGVLPKPGSFAALHRRWRSDDLVQLRLPQSFRAEPIDDQHPKVVAIMRGPVMLVAVDPPNGREKRVLPIDEGISVVAQRPGAWMPFHQVQNQRYTTYFTRG